MEKNTLRILVESLILLFAGVLLLIAVIGGFSFTFAGLRIAAHHPEHPVLVLLTLLAIKKFLTGTFFQGLFWLAPAQPVLATLNRRLERMGLRLMQARYPVGLGLLFVALWSVVTSGLWHALQQVSVERGLTGRYYQTPDWTGAPLRIGRDTRLDLQRMQWKFPTIKENFSIAWTGALAIPVSGKYTFALTSDDGAELFLDGQRIVNDAGIHGVRTVAQTIELQHGMHPVTIRYMQRTGNATFELSLAHKGKPLQSIPAQLLFPTSAPSGLFRERLLHLVFWIAKGIWLGSLIVILVWVFTPGENPYHLCRSVSTAFGLIFLGLWLMWRKQGHLTASLQDEIIGWLICTVGVLAALLLQGQTRAFQEVRSDNASWHTARVFRHGEEAALALIPCFLFVSLRKYLPDFFWQVLPVILLIGWVRDRALARSIKVSLLRSLLVAAFIAVVMSLWNMYDLDDLFTYSDTRVFEILAGYPLSNVRAWLFEMPRPLLTPLIFKLFQNDLAALNELFIVIYMLSAGVFIAVIMRFWTGSHERMLACYLFMLFFLNQHDMSLWLSCALTETSAIAVMLGVLTLFSLLFQYRPRLQQDNRMASTGIALVLLTTLLFVMARDTFLWVLPVLMLFYWAVFRRWRQRILLALGMLVIFGIAQKLIGCYPPRWDFPLGNVVLTRIVPDDQLRKLFQTHYHLPPDEVILPCANVRYVDPCPEESKQAIKKWLHTYGLQAYQRFLLTHPDYAVTTWLKAWDTMQANLWRLEYEPKYYADPRLRDKQLNPLIFNFPGLISLPITCGLLLFGGIVLRKNPLIGLCLIYTGIVGFMSFHGDSFEVERHAQQAAMTLKIAWLLSVVEMYYSVKLMLRNNVIASEAKQSRQDCFVEDSSQ